MHRNVKAFLFAPAFIVAAACSKDKPVDSSLNNDLTLAAQARQTATLDSISAAERARAVAPAPLVTAGTSTPARRTTTSSAPRRRTSSGSSSSGSSGSSSGSVASQPREVVVKNTKRDAAIGAAAGAIIGATTSRDKIKGGVIGAAAGGILGAVIGNNVDKHTTKVP
ncbi:MAG: YMGG-like glycine zipper-containing protein [Gemmatimonadaceae bacterium]